MKLGKLSIKNNLILAPMQEVTTAPYRRFCRAFQTIGLVCVPMIYTKRVETCPNSVIPKLYKIEEEKPVSVQIIGSDPKALKKTIIFLENFTFDVLDVNVGCPSRRSIKAQEGGYLLNDLNKLNRIIETIMKYSSKFISLKFRTGFDKKVDLNQLIRILNNFNLEYLTVHGRTVKDRYNDAKLDLDSIKEIKIKANIPVVGNGDIDNPFSAKKFLDYTKVDALMIGRGSIGNPEIFKQIDTFIKKKKYIAFKNNISKMKQYVEIYEQYIDEYIDKNLNYGFSIDSFKFIELKRNSIWLTKNIKNSTEIRKDLSKARDLPHLRKVLHKYFN